MPTVISVENLGKKYTISHQQRGDSSSLREVITNSAASFCSKLIKPFRTNLAPRNLSGVEVGPLPLDPEVEDFWALKDVSFEVKQGERVGIIGRNGAGKSTLLKILSRITEPTTGRVKIKGRVASLLEVGTGFHPELTGRENIYLNGAILGMGRQEINRKFDEIVAFSEIEKFLDTPVKRYSSGMYVRLAFAVAAHLEPEILIVDEVLSVGDAQFQKKCMGKMEDVSSMEGRTVVFVSHNMGAVRELCSRVLILDSGAVDYEGDSEGGIYKYLKSVPASKVLQKKNFAGPLSNSINIQSIGINDLYENVLILPGDEIQFVVQGNSSICLDQFRFSISVMKDGLRICTLHDSTRPAPLMAGQFKISITVPAYTLRPGQYIIGVGGNDGKLHSSGFNWLYSPEAAAFLINEVWDESNDIDAVGFVNISHTGRREYE